MPTPADHLPEHEIRMQLQRAAWDKRRANRAYKTIIEIAHQHGWGHTEIAKTIGVTEAAVRNMLRRSAQGGKKGGKVGTR